MAKTQPIKSFPISPPPELEDEGGLLNNKGGTTENDFSG
jgi:hypothetical protein